MTPLGRLTYGLTKSVIPNQTLLTFSIAPARFHTHSPLQGPKAAKGKAPAPSAVGKATTKLEKKKIRVETDPELLAKYCCINHNVDSDTPGPEIREDDFYPDWLWTLNLTNKPFYELDPKTEEYWHRKQRSYQFHKARLRKAKPYGIL